MDTSEDSSSEMLSNISGERISISNVYEQSVESVIDEYPFTYQSIITGDITYFEFSEFQDHDDPWEVEASFQLRTGSKLFILRTRSDLPKPETVIQKLDSVLAPNYHIYHNLFSAPGGLWDFFDAADRILDVTVLVDGDEIPYEEATGRTDDWGKHQIERGTAAFDHNGDSAVVRYSRGSLSISQPRQSDESQEQINEYIIQLLEKHVLSEV
jgi:hypothetical protein